MHFSKFAPLVTLALAAFTGLAGGAPIAEPNAVAVPEPYRTHRTGNTRHRTSGHRNGKNRKGSNHRIHAGTDNPPTKIGPGYSIKDLPGLPESKQKPPLISGNIVVTAEPSIIIKSFDPDTTVPESQEAKEALQLDILRGALGHQFNYQTHKDDITTTIVVFDTPQIAHGKECSFHFFWGSGDSSHVNHEIVLWSLDGRDNKFPVEFETTWNNRPYRNHEIARLRPNKGPDLSTGGDSPDAQFHFFGNPLIQNIKHDENHVARFSCDPFVGKRAFELVYRPGTEDMDEHGHPQLSGAAWSMNKGLMIEVHGVQEPSQQEQKNNEYDLDNVEDTSIEEWEDEE
ncbi:hypothetical protein BDZ91DRAFT_803157 [Kalaharituber pfeilii]|nr:hypothetical protein BDZ91DRAFT_803157 [Kalaharituber pfeilii]